MWAQNKRMPKGSFVTLCMCVYLFGCVSVRMFCVRTVFFVFGSSITHLNSVGKQFWNILCRVPMRMYLLRLISSAGTLYNLCFRYIHAVLCNKCIPL